MRRATPTPNKNDRGPGGFLSTLSLRRATLIFAARQAAIRVFLSTLSLRRATALIKNRTAFSVFLSTLSLRRATGCLKLLATLIPISIHALLAESDVTVLGIQHKVGISIHALLAESDGISACMCITLRIFLSTLSLRRATHANRYYVGLHLISIHALLAESDASNSSRAPPTVISIHALLAESDHTPIGIMLGCILFLSTLSLRRATCS